VDGVQAARLARAVLGLDRATVIEGVDVEPDGTVVVSVRPRVGTPMRCGQCRRETTGYDRGRAGVSRRWRALDWGPWKVVLQAEMRRADCLFCGAKVVAVPWARHDTGHTREFDQQVAWLARYASQSTVATLMRIAWKTVGRIVSRVMADAVVENEDRFDGVRRIGIDDVAYRKGHKYLTVVYNHDTGTLLWVGVGRKKTTLGTFFSILGEERCKKIELVSADGADWIADMVSLNCPKAKLCLDPYHLVSWVNDAVNKLRGRLRHEAQRDKAKSLAGLYSDSRWVVLKDPTKLSSEQQQTLAELTKINTPLFRAYLLKEKLRQILAQGGVARIRYFNLWLAWAIRSRIPEMVDLARRLRRYSTDIAHTLRYGLTNGPVEGLNSRIRQVINNARGFQDTDALMAMLRLTLGPHRPTLPSRA
jgi:transposase